MSQNKMRLSVPITHYFVGVDRKWGIDGIVYVYVVSYSWHKNESMTWHVESDTLQSCIERYPWVHKLRIFLFYCQCSSLHALLDSVHDVLAGWVFQYHVVGCCCWAPWWNMEVCSETSSKSCNNHSTSCYSGTHSIYPLTTNNMKCHCAFPPLGCGKGDTTLCVILSCDSASYHLVGKSVATPLSTKLLQQYIATHNKGWHRLSRQIYHVVHLIKYISSKHLEIFLRYLAIYKHTLNVI